MLKAFSAVSKNEMLNIYFRQKNACIVCKTLQQHCLPGSFMMAFHGLLGLHTLVGINLLHRAGDSKLG